MKSTGDKVPFGLFLSYLENKIKMLQIKNKRKTQRGIKSKFLTMEK